VIYNFVDFSQFDRLLCGEDVRLEFGIAPDAPVVVMLGGVAEPKGTIVLVRALPALVAAVPGVRVIVAGPPPHSFDGMGLKSLAKRLLRTNAYDEAILNALSTIDPAARSAIRFVGIRQDVPHLLAAGDCLVFPSIVPHFARPIIEAAAMGKPAVASDLGGPRELIRHGETGLLVPSGNPKLLAEALASMLNDPQRRHLMGEAAYQRAGRLFEARTNAAATVAVYEELLRID
jgi:glycosyltransferase involved in cell wall biosynthesis